jgi:hypothetical protein
MELEKNKKELYEVVKGFLVLIEKSEVSKLWVNDEKLSDDEVFNKTEEMLSLLRKAEELVQTIR